MFRFQYDSTVTSRAFAYYHAWRYIARSLEAILDHGRPTSAVYELFEHLYMSINEIGHETRYRYLPDLQRSVTSMRIRERQAQRWAGMLGAREAALQSASSPLLAEMARFNERMLRHMTTSAQCFDTIDWLDVDAIPDRVREYARAMRHSVEVELTSVYGVQRLVEDDFLDILRVYAVLAPLFADNTVFLEELRVRFTRKPVQLDRRPLATRRGSTGGQWQGKLSMISRIEYAGSQLASEFMQVLAIQSWRKGTRDYPQHAITNDAASYENAAQFEEMVADTHVLMAHMLRTMDRAVREVLPEYVEIVERRRACLKSVCEEDVASTSDSEEPDDTESEVQDQPAKLEEVESTSAVDEDVTTALDSLALDETPQKSPAVPSVPPRHHVCHELKTATAFRYNDPHFFNPRLKTDTSTTIPVPTIIDRSAMLTLCQLRGTLKGGENLSWTAIVKLITATLHGTVELKGGSRTTFFVPTPRAYAIAVDRPHPSNRIGHKIYQVRDVLFKKFGIEIEEFVAVGVKSG